MNHVQVDQWVLAARPEVGRLVLGSWIDLVVVDPASGALFRRDPARGWTPVESAAAAQESIKPIARSAAEA